MALTGPAAPLAFAPGAAGVLSAPLAPPRHAAGVPPATAAVGLALALDLLAGEPPAELHPVAWFGRLVAPLERAPRPGLVGPLAAGVLPLGSAVAVAALVAAAGGWRLAAGVGLAALWLFVATSLRRLLAVAGEVNALVDADIDEGRERLRALAGRDAAALSPGQVRSAVVESLAENLADGLVGPLGAFALAAAAGTHPLAGVAPGTPPVVALAFGAGAAAWVKAVNTMDSMLGYRTKPVGRAPARLDDLVMWVPARASALLLAVVARRPSAIGRARPWLGAVPSPNSGWPMGVAAAAVGVRLEKPGAYVLPGGPDPPTGEDVARARRLCAGAGLLAYLLAGVATWA